MQNQTIVKAKPFIKWAGGKSQILSELIARIPEKITGRYYEPFLGGGALFFALEHQLQIGAVKLSDINGELVNAYRVVRYSHSLDELIKVLEEFKQKHSKSFYYFVRSWDRDPDLWKNTDDVYRAARFIYLNKTGFNGLYRENQKGQNNVPIGRYKNPNICDEPTLRACNYALYGAGIGHISVDNALADTAEGDFAYFDPPYAPVSETSDFTSYTAKGFYHKDQIALRDLCVELDRRGVKWMLSNSAAPAVRELYTGFNIDTVQASRSINSKASKRGKVDEFIIRNYVN